MDIWVIRFILFMMMSFTAVAVQPLQGVTDTRWANALVGGAVALVIIVFEMRIRRLNLKTLIGALIGSTTGIIGATLISMVLSRMTAFHPNILTFFQVAIILFMAYVGLVVGSDKGNLLNMEWFESFFNVDKSAHANYKILDTSVIIDGRIADICDTGFVDGIILVPQFVLNELQMVADSSDSIRRNRGRRGLDILARMQKTSTISVKITEQNYPDQKEVDLKLIELAQEVNGKIVTNDFNLNKVAQLRGVRVLNINELANAIKPVVLPGEGLKVFILKEGKEGNQGVAYLDDGTMVVVDEGRNLIGRNVDVAVTSLLQTTAGKMIFGKITRVHNTGPSAGAPAEPVRDQRGR